MKKILYPQRLKWAKLSQRPSMDNDQLDGVVSAILQRVKKSGDVALREITQEIDNITLNDIQISDNEIADSRKALNDTLTQSIQSALENIKAFHTAQKREVMRLETMPGVMCWRKALPIEKVGIYIPGGSAPLFSTVLMLAIPAQLAGCPEIILCTPPGKDGKVNAAILFAAQLIGIQKIFAVGGAQAIGAMAYGTETVPKVYKIFGPGNQYVTKAKQLVSQQNTAIDMPAGPSEVLIIADKTANPTFVAADLLSQAEHGPDSQVVLLTTDETLIDEVELEIKYQLTKLPRASIASKALEASLSVLFTEEQDLIDFTNQYAPEHLIINTSNAETISEKVVNAGSVFIGPYTPEAVGDYASGTNHTLPTSGFAKVQGGVALESFMKYITFQKITPEGLQKIGPIVESMADAEELQGHKFAVTVRLDTLK